MGCWIPLHPLTSSPFSLLPFSHFIRSLLISIPSSPHLFNPISYPPISYSFIIPLPLPLLHPSLPFSFFPSLVSFCLLPFTSIFPSSLLFLSPFFPIPFSHLSITSPLLFYPLNFILLSSSVSSLLPFHPFSSLRFLSPLPFSPPLPFRPLPRSHPVIRAIGRWNSHVIKSLTQLTLGEINWPIRNEKFSPEAQCAASHY